MNAGAKRVTGWRKLAGASWGAPRDPQFYGELDVDAAAALDHIERARRRTGVHLTMTHLVGKAVAVALAEVPELSVRLARGRQHRRESIDVFFIVSTEGGNELTGVKVAGADRKPVLEIAGELAASGNAAGLDRGKALLARLPRGLTGLALRLGAWLTSDLDLDLSRLGMPRQAFGGAMVTSVGMWGVERAFSPLASYYRVPVLVLVGAVHLKPVVVAGEVLARPVLPLTATFDHRYTDGFHAARFAAAMRDYLAEPGKYEC